MTLEPHGTAAFLLYSTGGRQTALSAARYNVVVLLERTPDSEAHDCRFLLDGSRIELGRRAVVPFRLLAPETFSRLAVGQTLFLWEGKIVGEAAIVSLDHRVAR